MKVSYNWLQTFFNKPLPLPEEVVRLFESHLAEVESVEKVGEDTIIDVNILPDRACYALSHEGIAFELSQLGDFGYQWRQTKSLEVGTGTVIEIEDKAFCDRYIAVRIENIDNTIETPPEIKAKLLALGQRSINFLVDLANFVMLDVGQPLHVFDARLVSDKILVRRAYKDESITTLDERTVTLTEDDVVIADSTKALAIAGIKGGKAAESTKETTDIVLEAAHFNPTQVRKTAQRIGIKTDASKRYENNLSSVYAGKGALLFVETLKKYQPEAIVRSFDDQNFTHLEATIISVDTNYLSDKIGVALDTNKVKTILERMFLTVEETDTGVKLIIPDYRRDLRIKEDIADEVGRIVGYGTVEAVVPKFDATDAIDQFFVVGNKIRNFLTDRGFSEVYTYSLSNNGEIEIQNPLASDKSYLRANLSDGIEGALTKNVYYAELLGLTKIQIFEIGKVFTKNKEHAALSIGVAYKKAAKGQSATEDIKLLRDELFAFLSPQLQTVCSVDDTGGLLLLNNKQIGTINNKDGILELDLDAIIAAESKAETFEALQNRNLGAHYQKVSEFPFTSRDVAVFVAGPRGKEEVVLSLIKQQAGELLVRSDLFDVFEKKNKETGEIEKTSYAFRLVFQSFEKTLTDQEVDPIMEKIYSALKNQGYEIR